MSCEDITTDLLEQLREFKDACIKIRDSLVAGHEETTTSPRKLSCVEETNGKVSNFFRYCSSGTPSPVACDSVEVPEGFWEEYGPHKQWPSSTGTFPLAPLEEEAYRVQFYKTEHWNYYVEDETDVGPCLLSIKQEEQETRTLFRVIVRSPDYYVHGLLLPSNLSANRYDKDDIVSSLGKEMSFTSLFRYADKPNLPEEILELDEAFLKNTLKVGALLVRPGQNSEEAMLGNQHIPGGPFDELLKLLGDRVALKGFNRFLGGLDAHSNLTGKESVFTEFKGIEIMFHVSTLLPYSDHDQQQVNRKRHIGNDITCLVFLEGPDCHFNPLWIRSHFLHCFIVVQLLSETTSEGLPLYRVSTISRNHVPFFDPELRHYDTFPAGPLFRDFLLTKIINSDRSCYYAPKFLRLTSRTRLQLMSEFVSTLSDKTEKSAAHNAGRRGSWIPNGAVRPPSSFTDSVKDNYDNSDRLADDLTSALCSKDLMDTTFLVGPSRVKMYGVRAILACRSSVMGKLFMDGVQHWNIPSSTRRSVSPCNNPRSSTLKKRHSTGEPFEYASGFDEPRSQPSEPYTVDNIEEYVFRELLCYFMTGSCTIQPSNVVGLGCAAEYFDVPDLRQACLDHLIRCLSSNILCQLLNQLEKHLTCQTAKNMLFTILQFADNNAEKMLKSRDFLNLSEHMLLVVMQRNIQATEILKVKALLAWAELNTAQGRNRQKTLQPLLKNIQLQLISAQDLMKIVVPSGLFSSDKVMEALAYQADPTAFDS